MSSVAPIETEIETVDEDGAIIHTAKDVYVDTYVVLYHGNKKNDHLCLRLPIHDRNEYVWLFKVVSITRKCVKMNSGEYGVEVKGMCLVNKEQDITMPLSMCKVETKFMITN